MTTITPKQAAQLLDRLGLENVEALLELVSPKQTTNEAMNDWIRDRAAKGVHRHDTIAGTATTPAATTTTANAGAHGIPAVKESSNAQMNRAIRSAAGRGEK